MGKEGQGDVGCVTINLPDPPMRLRNILTIPPLFVVSFT